MIPTLLSIEGMSHAFGGVRALEDVSVRIQRGTVSSLIGPNGAGKTTVFNCVTGVLRPDRGAIGFGVDAEHDLVRLPPDQIAACGVARTFQMVRLFPQMTVLENVLVGTHLRTRAGIVDAMLRRSWARREEQWARDHARGILRQLQLEELAVAVASTLPYGLQKRLEIARALATDPQLLLLDEPAAGLTAAEKAALMEVVRELRARGLTIWLIEHDMRFVMPISDRIIVLDHGMKIAEGTPAEIQGDPRVIEAYLGTPEIWGTGQGAGGSGHDPGEGGD